MQKKVFIDIIGKQSYPEGHEDLQETSTFGAYYERNGAVYVVYKESGNESIGLGDVSTFICIKDDSVTLNRKGAIDSKQVFKIGELNRSIYTTRYGKLWLSVMPNKIEIDLTVHGGRISLEYDLFIDDHLVSHNVLLLSIKEDSPNEPV